MFKMPNKQKYFTGEFLFVPEWLLKVLLSFQSHKLPHWHTNEFSYEYH